MALRICDWKHDKRWVYSITYDEALADLHRFTIPHHEDLGIPGHLEIVVGQIGEIRNIGTSTFNGFRHMNADELKEMMARGWGVGSHAWTHHRIKPEMVDQEIRVARDVLEEAIGAPVPLYVAPNGNENLSDHVIVALREHGFLAGMSITDGVNEPALDPFFLLRTALHDNFGPPFFNAYDPYRNLRAARDRKGWIIDYLHCPLEVAMHANKDCNHLQLRARLETILSEGSDEVWCALPEEVMYYHWCRAHAAIETTTNGDGPDSYRVTLAPMPERVACRELTFEVDVSPSACQSPRVWVNGQPRMATLVRPRVLRATVDVGDGVDLRFEHNEVEP
jgi:hypothetical protein